MDHAALSSLADAFLAAWNTQDVSRVLACYATELEYRDPNTRGSVRGSDAMRNYLTKLFSKWTMHWVAREVHPLRDSTGVALLWTGTFRRGPTGAVVTIDGMDLVILSGGLIARNDVYFDRSPLAALSGV